MDLWQLPILRLVSHSFPSPLVTLIVKALFHDSDIEVENEGLKDVLAHAKEPEGV